ncbi:MAG: hypothetical protein AAF756_23220, partial [Pseudomonadota bacterium]
MKLQGVVRDLFCALTLLGLGGCGVDNSGLGVYDVGTTFAIQCNFLATTNRFGLRFDNFSETYSYCVNDAATPSGERFDEICESQAERLESNFYLESSTAPPVIVESRGATARRLATQPCTLPVGDVASAVRSAQTSGTDGAGVPGAFHPPVGYSTLTNLTGAAASSRLRISAKFRSWRHAETSAEGVALFDYEPCLLDTDCRIVLRHLALDLRDFSIERPTRLARDVSIRSAQLRTEGSYGATLDEEGRFTLKNVQALVTGIVNGKRRALLVDKPSEIQGRLTQFRGLEGVGPQIVELSIDESTSGFAVRGNLKFTVDAFDAAVRHQLVDRCLRVDAQDESELRIISGSCSDATPFDYWSFRKRDTGFQLTRPLS